MAGSALASNLALGVARAPRPWLLWAIGLAGCAAAGATLALALASDGSPEPVARAVTVDWIVLSYILAGLIAWWCRPESRFGPLMVAAGFAAFLSHLSWTSLALPYAIDVPYTIGMAASLLPPVLFLHVFLAFPSGRLERWFERTLVAAAYVAAIGLGLVVMMLSDPSPHNLLGVVSEPGAALAVRRVALVAVSALSLAGIAVLVARRRGTGRPLRRSLALLIDAFALALVAIPVLLIASIFDPSGMETIRRVAYAVIGIAPFAFLFALLRARLARSSVGHLFVELRADPAPTDLRDALARALGDPSLTLAFWLPEFRSWADLEGRPVKLPSSGSGRGTTLIDRDGAHVAALLHDSALADEPELLDAVTAAAGIALENGRLNVELKARMEELRGSRSRVIEAGQKERQRLERNLHDGAQQRLIALSLELGLLEERAGRRSRSEHAPRSGEARDRHVTRRTARCRARHPSGRRERAWIGGCTRAARRESTGARTAERQARAPMSRASRGRCVLPRVREPRERGKARERHLGHRGGRSHERPGRGRGGRRRDRWGRHRARLGIARSRRPSRSS